MTDFKKHRGSESPVSSNLDHATIEIETRGGLTLKLAGNRVDWKHRGKDSNVLRWRVTFPEARSATAIEKAAVIRPGGAVNRQREILT